MSPFILYSDGEGNIFEDNHSMPADAADGMLYRLGNQTGLKFRKEVLSMNCPGGGGSASMWKPATCDYVTRDGLLQLLFRPHIPDFIWLLMKRGGMPLPFLYFVIPLPDGSMKNFMFPPFE